MKSSLKMTLAAAALGMAGLMGTAAVAPAAAANVGFSFTIGDVAFGYTDGYYDRNRTFHRWRSDRERQYYMKQNRSGYHAMRHDRDRERNNRWKRWDNNRNDRDGRRGH